MLTLAKPGTSYLRVARIRESNMQRDMDLIREILIQMAHHPHGYAPKIEISGHTGEEIGFHVWLLADAKLIKAIDVRSDGDSGPNSLPIHITWQGYEFLEAARSQSTWETGKKAVLSKAGGLSFELMKAYLMYEAKRHLGIG
jgi:Hypothetical protein (DUF2513)